MTETSRAKRAVAFIVGYVECLFFGAILAGWPSLVYLIKQDRIYGYLCYNQSNVENSHTNVSSPEVGEQSHVCLEEENIYNLIFGIGITFNHTSALSSALLLERFGLRNTRIFNSLLFVTSGIMLGVITTDYPHLLFIGIILLAIGTGQQRLIDFQIANFFPSSKTTVLSLYIGANIASSGIFVLFQYANDFAAIKWNTSFFIYGGLSFLMVFPTLFLFPENLVEKAKDHVPNISKNNQTKNKEITPLFNEKQNKSFSFKSKFQPALNDASTFFQSATSFSYIIHLYAVFIVALYTLTYNGAFNWWLDKTIKDPDTVRWLTEMFGNLQFITIAVQPLIGYTVDLCLRKARNAVDSTTRIQNERWTVFVILALLPSFAIASLLFTYHTTIAMIEISVIFFVFSKCIIAFVQPIYIRLRFPPAHFNKLFGIAGIFIALAAQIQHLIFLWIQNDPFTARSTVFVLLVLSFINPLHLFCLRKHLLTSI